MATTTTTTTSGLTARDLDWIRDNLAAGRKPKVMFTPAAGQIAGQTGQVVALTDPRESDEWVVVRFGRDELPFSPADLALPPRRKPARSTPAVAEAAPAVASPPSAQEGPMSTPTEEAAPVAAPAPDSSAAARDDGAAARPAKPKAAKRQPKPKPQPSLTVTLAYAEGEWTVSAQQGSRVLAKPYLIKPAEALKLVSLVDVPGVQEAVEQIVAAERAEAEQQAERLRAQLAEVEARLAELRSAG